MHPIFSVHGQKLLYTIISYPNFLKKHQCNARGLVCKIIIYNNFFILFWKTCVCVFYGEKGKKIQVSWRKEACFLGFEALRGTKFQQLKVHFWKAPSPLFKQDLLMCLTWKLFLALFSLPRASLVSFFSPPPSSYWMVRRELFPTSSEEWSFTQFIYISDNRLFPVSPAARISRERFYLWK